MKAGNSPGRCKMKLAYLVPEWPTQTHSFFWQEVCTLREHSIQVHLFSTRQPDAALCPHRFCSEAFATTKYLYPPRWRVALREILRCGMRSKDAIRYIIKLREAKSKEKIRLFGLLLCAADLCSWCRRLQIEHIHVHSCADAAHLVALAKKLGGPSFSLTLHGDLPVYGRDHDSKMFDAEFVAVVSRPLQDQLLKKNLVTPERAPIIWMGVDTARFTPSTQNKNRFDFVLTTVARLHPAKGHMLVLEAIAILRGRGIKVHYVIAGRGDFEADIRRRVDELELADIVTFAGVLDSDEVLQLLRQSDCFVLASTGIGEASPVSLMEAMSCGVPPIVSRIGGTVDMIDDELDGLLVDRNDISAIADAIHRVAIDHELRLKIGMNARRKAVSRFDVSATARKLSDCINVAAKAGTKRFEGLV